MWPITLQRKIFILKRNFPAFFLGEFGVYDLNVTECSLTTRVEPVNENLPILYCALGLAFLGILFRLGKWAVNKRYTAAIERGYYNTKKRLGYEVNIIFSRKIIYFCMSKIATIKEIITILGISPVFFSLFEFRGIKYWERAA